MKYRFIPDGLYGRYVHQDLEHVCCDITVLSHLFRQIMRPSEKVRNPWSMYGVSIGTRLDLNAENVSERVPGNMEPGQNPSALGKTNNHQKSRRRLPQTGQL
jgi:hypothetical protein